MPAVPNMTPPPSGQRSSACSTTVGVVVPRVDGALLEPEGVDEERDRGAGVAVGEARARRMRWLVCVFMLLRIAAALGPSWTDGSSSCQPLRRRAAGELDEVAVEVRLVVVAAGRGDLRDRRANGVTAASPRPARSARRGPRAWATRPNSSVNRRAKCWRLQPTSRRARPRERARRGHEQLPGAPQRRRRANRRAPAVPSTSSQTANRSDHASRPEAAPTARDAARPTTSSSSSDVFHSAPAGMPSSAAAAERGQLDGDALLAAVVSDQRRRRLQAAHDAAVPVRRLRRGRSGRPRRSAGRC